MKLMVSQLSTKLELKLKLSLAKKYKFTKLHINKHNEQVNKKGEDRGGEGRGTRKIYQCGL